MCNERTNLKTIPRQERFNGLKTAKIYIPAGAKLCAGHFDNVSWEAVSTSATIRDYNARQIEDMLNLALTQDKASDEYPKFDLESNSGLTIPKFDNMLSHIPSLATVLKSTKKAKHALLMLLMRYRTGLSYEYIANSFGVSRATATNHIDKARAALTESFVPNYLGFENLSRDFLLQNGTVTSRMLHCDNNADVLIVVFDGTYIFVNKSGNYEFQKQTYSGQKKSNFLRPMMCVTTNGYIIDVLGPFKANTNDAKCMQAILEKNTSVTEMMRPGDVFLLDRGFRDCLEDLEDFQYIGKTPHFIQKDHPTQQLTKEQANLSRLITKNRFVVEARNGHMKQIFPIFNEQWSTLNVKHLRKDLRIAAAMINKYFEKVVADAGKEEAIANAMLSRVTLPNKIHPIVLQKLFQDQITHFEPVDNNNFDFPQFTKEELQQITQGSYQLRQAKSYAHAHKKAKLRYNTDYLCYYCPNQITQRFFADIIRERNVRRPILVFTRMASRFVSGKSHDSYVLADADGNGPSAIIGYCCECKNGLRTVGCCSHVTTTIFYLGYARHNGGIEPVARHVENFFDDLFERIEDNELEGVQIGEEDYESDE